MRLPYLRPAKVFGALAAALFTAAILMDPYTAPLWALVLSLVGAAFFAGLTLIDLLLDPTKADRPEA